MLRASYYLVLCVYGAAFLCVLCRKVCVQRSCLDIILSVMYAAVNGVRNEIVVYILAVCVFVMYSLFVDLSEKEIMDCDLFLCFI